MLNKIYDRRGKDDPVILGNSHAALALYVVLEEWGYADAEELVDKHGVHAARDMDSGIWVSGGSLGQAETVAVGMALGDRSQKVWLVTSDGACSEGSVWEAFNVISVQNLDNLEIHLVANGYGAYGEIDINRLAQKIYYHLRPMSFHLHVPNMQFPWLQGLAGHYIVMNEDQYKEAMAS